MAKVVVENTRKFVVKLTPGEAKLLDELLDMERQFFQQEMSDEGFSLEEISERAINLAGLSRKILKIRGC